jgi:hypothetical protein
MTATEFRSSPERVAAWRDLLNNSLVANAIVCLRDERPSATVEAGSDALDRAAALARLEQHEADYNLLLSLAEPLPLEPTEDEMTFGVDKSKFQSPQ